MEESGCESLLWEVAAACSGASSLTSLSLRYFPCDVVIIAGLTGPLGMLSEIKGVKCLANNIGLNHEKMLISTCF